MSSAEIISLASAAERLGKPSWWLRRHVLKVERETGRKILVRVGKGPKRPTYRVNMARLRLVCPELFDVRDPIAQGLRESALIGRRGMAELLDEIAELRADVTAIAAAMRKTQRGNR